MNNSSVDGLLAAPPSGAIASYWIQLTFSAPAVLLNIPITVTMLLAKGLRNRREVVPCAMLSLFELMYAFSYILSAPLQLSNSNGRQLGISAWECMHMVYNTVVGFTSVTLPWSMLLVSVDRLLCIESIQRYSMLGPRYLLVVRVLPVPFGLASVIAGWIGSSMTPETITIHPGLCGFASAASPAIVFKISWFAAVPGFCGSTVVYAIAILLLWSRKHSIFASIAQAEKQRQIKVTKFIGMILCVTLCTQALPTVFNMAMSAWFPALQPTISIYITAVKMSHSLFYSLVLWTRSSEARQIFVTAFNKHVMTKTEVAVISVT